MQTCMTSHSGIQKCPKTTRESSWVTDLSRATHELLVDFSLSHVMPLISILFFFNHYSTFLGVNYYYYLFCFLGDTHDLLGIGPVTRK